MLFLTSSFLLTQFPKQNLFHQNRQERLAIQQQAMMMQMQEAMLMQGGGMAPDQGGMMAPEGQVSGQSGPQMEELPQ